MKASLCRAILASMPLAFMAPACAQENVESIRVELDTAHLRSRPDAQQSRRVTFDIPLAMVAPERRRPGPVDIIILHARVEDPANPTILPSATPSISAPRTKESFDILLGLTPDPAYPDCRPSACRDLVAQEMEDSLASDFERTDQDDIFIRHVRKDGDMFLVPLSGTAPRTTYLWCDGASNPEGRCLVRTTVDDGILVEYYFHATRIAHFKALDVAVRRFIALRTASDTSTGPSHYRAAD